MNSILLFGSDPLLLSTRADILTKVGFTVKATEAVMEAEQFILTASPQLVVVCHSAQVDDACRVLEAASTRPAVKRLLLLGPKTSSLTAWADEVHETSYGPGSFIARIRQMLPSQPIEQTPVSA